jgi:HSP20 family protein
MPHHQIQAAQPLRHDFDRLMNDLRDIHPFALLGDDMVWHPFCDVYETETELVVKVELAGVDKKDITISMAEGHLTIRGTRRDVGQGDDQRLYHKMEINQGYFERTIPVPESVASSRAASGYRDGILEVRLAKEQKLPIDIPIE